MIEGLNKAFENRLRLGIMGLLMVNDRVSFKELKENLDATDGNLASHIQSLEKQHYLKVEKQFVNRKPMTSYQISHKGRMAFEMHLKALEVLIRNTK